MRSTGKRSGSGPWSRPAAPSVAAALAGALAGAAAGAGAASLARSAPAEPPEWIRREIESVSRENVALRREIGRLRVELAGSLAELNADGDTAAAAAPGAGPP